MITVLGATGNTGSEIATRLLAAGEQVRVVGRSAERLELFAGAEHHVGNVADVDFLTTAFTGADAVYTLLPADPTVGDFHAEQDRLGSTIIDAIRASGVRRVVFLSSLGADRSEGTGVITALHRQEQRLRSLDGVDVTLLRPGLFFTSFRHSLPAIIHQGVHVDSVAPDVRLPMIDPADIAAAAVDALTARDWSGVVVRELLGPRDLTHLEVTAMIGAAVGKPDLPYVQLPYAEMAAGLVEHAGFSPNFAECYVEMTRGFNEGHVASTQGRGPANTTPSTFESYAPTLA